MDPMVQQQMEAMRQEMQQSQQQQPVRAISLKQLKDHIEQIYASKIKFDQKCKQANYLWHLPFISISIRL